MTLTARLAAFALAALAVVLVAFSLALYLLARHHLTHLTADRVDAAANVLAAAAEVRADGVEWEPAERRLGLGTGELAWTVSDPDGRVIDRSPADAADRLGDADWLVRRQRVEAGGPDVAPAPPGEATDVKYPALVVAVGAPLAPANETLRWLAAALAGVSVVAWLAALVAGRAVCRWALRPVADMAAAARGITPDALDQRLPTPDTADELGELGRAFNGLLARVHDAYERQRHFTAEASHQLRTPLAAVLGQVEVALRRERDGEEYRRVLGSVRGQADRLRRVVDALLFLARADADAALPDRERLDLGEWLPRHVRDTWAGHPRAADIRVEAEAAQADVHPVLLGELTDALIDNACKYGPPGSPVVVAVKATADGCELSVTDAGCGIAADDLARLFAPFVRTDDARRRGVDGLGLGLAVARRIAVAHGGTLIVTSAVGDGSRFTLTLPPAVSCSPLPPAL